MDDEIEEIRSRKRREMIERLSAKADASARRGTLDRPLEIDDRSIDDVIRSYPLIVVDCWAPWCGPCRAMAPVVEELSRKHRGSMVFAKLNVDQNPRTAARFQIMSIPSFLVFKRGRLVETIVGAMSASQLEQKLAAYL